MTREATARNWRGLAVACAAVLVCGLAPDSAALAANHALLVGVSDYPKLPQRLWLQAPGNDVALMGDTLAGLGFEPARVHRLASRMGGAQEPTRHNILAAMRQVLADLQHGDRVVLYLAGHGSQQPQALGRAAAQAAAHGKRPREPDGLDEVFLPADVERWQGGTAERAIPNALLDDEIGEWIDAAVDRGATVWAIFDTCHAGGMPRGRALRLRGIDPAELGLPVLRGPASTNTRTNGRTDGRALALAARAHEATGEEWLPVGAAMGSNRLQGVFTFHVAQALNTLARPTLADLERAVRAAYVRERRTAPTPEFKGDPALMLR